MSNVDRIALVIPELTGRFTLDQLIDILGEVGLTRDQVSKAVRSHPMVQILGKGEYRIKGRRTIK